MMAKDKLSELEETLVDNKMEAIVLTKELGALKATQKSMTAHIKDLEDENGNLEEEACDLFDKVNIMKIVLQMLNQKFQDYMRIFCYSG